MELRHLRYFIAVAEEGSLTLAAERRLHTAQPSLSRQMRDLEREVGATLLSRGPRGVELTASGRVFLDHARLVLLQSEAAVEAARRAAEPAKASFVLGFLTGHELVWLPEALRVLRAEVPDIDITLTSQSSPDLAIGLLREKIDAAFLRREAQPAGLAYRHLIDEPLVAILPADHPLAAESLIRPEDLARYDFVSPTRTAPALKLVIDAFARQAGITLIPTYVADNLSSVASLVTSTGGVALLPAYAESLMPPSVVVRRLAGKAPTIELVIGTNKANTSPLLRRFLTHADELVAHARRVAAA